MVPCAPRWRHAAMRVSGSGDLRNGTGVIAKPLLGMRFATRLSRSRSIMHWIATLSRAVLPAANTSHARGEAAIQTLIGLLRWIAAPLILCLGLTSAALAQARFEAVGPEYDVAAVPGLRIVTI